MIQLRDYQIRLVDEARQSIAGGCKRLLIQAACGSGKTNLAAYITNEAIAKNNTVMFCCHRNELLMQASRTMSNFGIEHGLIAAKYTQKLYCKVQIAMIDTLRNRLDLVAIPSILFVDEAHHAVSPTWKKIINYYADRGSIIVGLSATPQRLDGKSMGDMFNHMISGPSIQSLMEADYLAHYKYYAPPSVVDMDGVGKRFGEYDIKEQALRIDKPHVFGDAIEHYKKILSGKKAIAFQVNIQSSKNFAAQCVSQGIPCLHVDGEMPASERARAIKSFEEGQTLILSNVGLFGEGFDVRSCDGVILLRKTASLSLYLQMCGRAMRPHDSKEYAIIIDHMDNVSLHGLPDYYHEWSLDGEQRGKAKQKSADDIKIKQCTQCYHVFTPQPCCPNCGHEVGLNQRELEIIEGELMEITNHKIKIEQRKEVGQAKTQKDLEQIARDRGYNIGWARHVWHARSNKMR